MSVLWGASGTPKHCRWEGTTHNFFGKQLSGFLKVTHMPIIGPGHFIPRYFSKRYKSKCLYKDLYTADRRKRTCHSL